MRGANQRARRGGVVAKTTTLTILPLATRGTSGAAPRHGHKMQERLRHGELTPPNTGMVGMRWTALSMRSHRPFKAATGIRIPLGVRLVTKGPEHFLRRSGPTNFFPPLSAIDARIVEGVGTCSQRASSLAGLNRSRAFVAFRERGECRTAQRGRVSNGEHVCSITKRACGVKEMNDALGG
jgi:hypothetical protein